MKLIKTVDEQGVMYSLSGDSLPENYVLSLKKCQAIERGYDLDELAKKTCPDVISSANSAYKAGFQKALEILGDKKFSEDDVINAHSVGRNYQRNAEMDCHITPYLKSLQQTEWDCIIEMECCGNYSAPCKYNCEYGTKPKLDADGCLILKNI